MPQTLGPGVNLPSAPRQTSASPGGSILSNLWSHWYPGQAPAAPTSIPGQTIVPGAPAFNYDPSFGGIPGVPSPAASASQALGGNIGNLGQIYSLGGGLNQFTAQQAPTSLNLNLPNYQNMIGTSSGNILSKLRGQIPQDVINQLGQLAAERGVATGGIGSPNSEAALLRSLGLTSLDLQNQGESQLTGAIARTPQGAQFNPFGFLVTPEEQQAAQYQANLLNAAPVPSSAAAAGYNALQAGRNSGYSGFPTSAPSSFQPYAPPTSPAQLPLGGINPRTTGGTAYASSRTVPGYGGFQPGDFESMGFFDDQSAPYSPFQPGDFEAMGFGDSTFPEDLFGDFGG